MADNNKVPTMISERIVAAMEEQGKSIRDIAKETGATYEHIRMIVRGEAVPSRFMLRTLSETLGLPIKEMERLSQADRIRMKFGTVPLELAGKNPEIERIERAWPHLNASDKEDLYVLAESRAKRNRAEARRA